MLFRKSKNLVGLDIGSSAIKLVELKDAKGGGYRLVKTGLESLSPEAIVDGAIMDASLVVDTVNRVVSALSVRNNDFGTSLSGHSVIIKKISLPAMSPEELAESIRWEAEQYVPFDINDVNLDYVVLESAGGETMRSRRSRSARPAMARCPSRSWATAGSLPKTSSSPIRRASCSICPASATRFVSARSRYPETS